MKKSFLKLVCLAMLTLPLASCGQAPVHTHTADGKWHNDLSSHWHVCTGNDNYIMDKEEHTFGDPVIVQATCTEAGSITYECEVCGKQIVHVIQPKGHDYSDIGADGDYHWLECAVCGDVELTTVSAHSWFPYLVVTEATCTTPGSAIYVCLGCGAYKLVTIPATGHTWSEGYVHDAQGHHMHFCEDCLALATEDDGVEGGYGDCSFVKCYDDHNHWEECEVCGTIKDGTIGHHKILVNKTEEGHWVTCNDQCGYETELEPHNFVDGVCDVCGYEKEITSIESFIKDLSVGDTATVVGQVVSLFKENPSQGIFIASGEYAIQVFKYEDTDVKIGDYIEVTGSKTFYSANRTTEIDVSNGELNIYSKKPASFVDPVPYIFNKDTWDSLTTGTTSETNLFTNRPIQVEGIFKSITGQPGSNSTAIVEVDGKEIEVYIKYCVDTQVVNTFFELEAGDPIMLAGVIASYNGKTQIGSPCYLEKLTANKLEITNKTELKSKEFYTTNTFEEVMACVTANVTFGNSVVKACDLADLTVLSDGGARAMEVGTYTVQLGYKSSTSITDSFEFTVGEDSRGPLTAIKLDLTAFNEIEWLVGDVFTTDSIVVTAEYESGDTAVVPYGAYVVSDELEGSVLEVAGTLEFTISYTAGEVTKSASVSTVVKEAPISFVASEQGWANGAAVNSWTSSDGKVALSFVKNSGTQPAYYSSGKGSVRLYNANTLKITCEGLTKVEFVFDSDKDGSFKDITAGTYVGDKASGTWTGEANEVSFTVASGQRRIISMVFYR